MDTLFRELRRLAAEFAPRGLPVIIGGGYGLLLRQRRVERQVEHDGTETLMDIPVERTTRDLDIFLTVEILADAEKAEAVREVLETLGYVVIPGRESYQFAQVVDETEEFPRGVKIDLLAPVPRDMGEHPKLKLDRIRPDHKKIKNRDVGRLNAFATPEAFTIAEQTEIVWLNAGSVRGEAISGESDEGTGLHAEIPHPFTYLILKLFAYRDRQDDESKDFRYHAYDLYRIVAMLTEADLTTVEEMRERFGADPVVVEASRIVAELFEDADDKGGIAIQAYSRVVGSDLSTDDISAFCVHLKDLLPLPADSQS